MKASPQFAPGSAAFPTQRFVFIVRAIVALIWLYEGLWQKVIARDAHEFSIVRQFAASDAGALQLMTIIGLGETLLAAAVLSGFFARPLAWLQIALLVTMNLTGIFFGGGTIANPVGLLIHNLPLIACMTFIGLYDNSADTNLDLTTTAQEYS